MAIDWLAALDFTQALRNCHNDILGDWHRDPWGWPELDWLVPTQLQSIAVPHLNSRSSRRAAKLDVAKENFGTRPALVMDPLDRLLYQALIDRLSVKFIGSSPDWLYGWRLARETPNRGRYVRNDFEWAAYRDHLKRLANWDACALRTDIVSFFASIPTDLVAEQVIEIGRSDAVCNRIVTFLEGWSLIPGRSGLPQRSASSAVLAHMYLAPADDVLRHYNTIRGLAKTAVPEGRGLRWMDDIWLFGPDPGRLRRAQLELQSVLRGIGLEMNSAKTDVLEDEEVGRAVQELEHSAVDQALNDDPRAVEPLDELIDRVIASPEHADRTTISFITTRMREHTLFDRVSDLADVAERMPQGADHLGRLFRDSGAWSDLQQWYVTYAKSNWGSIDWSVAQLATMFPSRKSVAQELVDFTSEVVANRSQSLALASVAAQRIAVWKPSEARYTIREASQVADHPLFRRSFALAAVAAGERRDVLRSSLSEFEENRLTLLMLEDFGFRKQHVAVKADFAA